MEREILEKYKKAGSISGRALILGKKLVKEGESVVKILDEIDQFIRKEGAIPAFPSQISINNVAAHFCPTDENDVILKEEDVIKLDVGACVDGYIGDNARTFVIGDKHKELQKCSREALNEVLKIIGPDTELQTIGKRIQEVITSYGFSPIRNLSGHGLGRYEVHEVPTIPNFDTGDDSELDYDDVIAIEPFASTGAGVVYESSNPTIFSLVSEKPVRSSITREVLREIKTYHGLPFTTRWLARKFGAGKTAFALRELKVNEMLQEHPPLLDKAQGLVSQAEHSIIIGDKPIVFTKVDDDE